MNVYINCIGRNWVTSFLSHKKLDFYVELNEFLMNKIKKDIDKVYFITDEIIVDSNGKILVSYENIIFITASNFSYTLKHLSTLGQVQSDTIILSNNVWDYYLVLLGLTVYIPKVKGDLLDLDSISKDYLKKKYGSISSEQYLDYLILQEKNDDSIGQGKTLSLLKKYGSVEKLIESIDTVEDSRIQGILQYQITKFEYYLQIKKFFLTQTDISGKN